MLAVDGEIPCFIGLVLMIRKPPDYDFQLSARQRACQQFPVYRDDSLIVAVIHMNMRLIMLSHVTKQHINNHAAKPAQFRHLLSLHISRFIYLTIPFGKNPQKSARREIKSQRARLVCNQNSS